MAACGWGGRKHRNSHSHTQIHINTQIHISSALFSLDALSSAAGELWEGWNQSANILCCFSLSFCCWNKKFPSLATAKPNILSRALSRDFFTHSLFPGENCTSKLWIELFLKHIFCSLPHYFTLNIPGEKEHLECLPWVFFLCSGQTHCRYFCFYQWQCLVFADKTVGRNALFALFWCGNNPLWEMENPKAVL